MKKIEALLVVDPYAGDNRRHIAAHTAADLQWVSDPVVDGLAANLIMLDYEQLGEASSGNVQAIGLATDIEVLYSVRRVVDSERSGMWILESMASVEGTGDHNLSRGQIVANNHLCLKQEPFLGYYDRYVLIVMIHGEDGPGKMPVQVCFEVLPLFSSGAYQILVFDCILKIASRLTMASSLGRLPKFKPLPWPCRLDGGLPPLAGGCGIGEGEVCGEVMRGFPGLCTAREFAD